MSNNKSRCYNCPDRYPGCHAYCQDEDYIKEEKRKAEIREKKRIENLKYYETYDYGRDSYNRLKRNKHICESKNHKK
jgi:hypothetical protein